MESTREIISDAVATGRAVRILYRDYYGTVTERKISQVKWAEYGKISAFCHLRQDERNFRLDNILQCERLDDVPTAKSATETSKERRLDHEVSIETPQPTVRKTAQKPKQTRATRAKSPLPARFTRVENAEQWSRLVSYYAECLVHENLQQYVIKNETSSRFFFSMDRKDLWKFMAGSIQLEFQEGQASRPTAIATFVKQRMNGRHQQLCLGFPIFVVNQREIAPLLFCAVSVEEADGKLVLRAEDPEASYAALHRLGLDDEEISSVLASCADIETPTGKSSVEALEESLIAQLAEVFGEPLECVPWNGKGSPLLQLNTLCDAPCLFWVQDNIATQSLIGELRELAEPTMWESVPVALKEMLSRVPERDYPATPPPHGSQNVYVVEANEDQRQAIAAMSGGNITVVTGPPGTGKSQLVLNMVAQALMSDESVLFASRNNQAVDVVMTRLQGELEFPGAVRTGNRTNRRKAVADMTAALNQISTVKALPSILPLRERYHALNAAAERTEEELHQVRELKGLRASHEAERSEIVALLPGPVVDLAETSPPKFTEEEIEHLQRVISTLLTTAFSLRENTQHVEDDIRAIIRNNRLNNPLLDALRLFEEQWGTFGGGFLHVQQFDTLEEYHSYVQTWISLIPAFEMQREVTELSGAYRALSSSYLEGSEQLHPRYLEHVARVVSAYPLDELSSLAAESAQIAQQTAAVVEGRLSLWQRLLIVLRLRNPQRKVSEYLANIERRLELDSEVPIASDQLDLDLLGVACSEAAEFLRVCALKRQMNETGEDLEWKRERLSEHTEHLPAAIRQDVTKVEVTEVRGTTFVEALKAVLGEIETMIERRDRLVARVNSKIDANEDSLHFLGDFRSSPAGKDKRLWTLRVPCPLQVILRHLTKWRNLLLLLATNATLEQLNRQAESLPSIADLRDKLGQLQNERLATGAEIMRTQWLVKTKSLDTPTIQRTHHYVSAVQQLSGEYNADIYKAQKPAEKGYLPSALRTFSVWATTNLTAKTNLPLTPGLFDTVIIDEASQCDVPSALPLLYRAKRIVVIGDPNQLNHVATLFRDSDMEAASRFGVAPEAFLYTTHSLFDIAKSAVGVRPGTLLLKEHYRSDPRIVQFSNEEFYNDELQIRTDMEQRGVSKDFADVGCGVFWLQVDGVTEHPPRGSAFNRAELHAVQVLVPRLLSALERWDMNRATVGIVTPYREQANQLQEWVMKRHGQGNQIMVGTAHVFQGNERDIMIFSPVLAPGLSEGSLRWLESTANLLNVSVTRARNALIVVGNWDYCKGLSANSKYRRLAEYIGDRRQSMVREVDSLPLLGGKPFQVIGTLLNPVDSEYNRLTLRRLITSCKQFVWWMDVYFQDHVFDLFWDAAQHRNLDIKDVRLLTALEQIQSTDGRKPSITQDRASALKGELQRQGVSFEMRLLPKRELPHDRHLYSLGQAINMPPFSGAYGDHKHVSEYTESKTNPTFFEEYWNRAQVIE